MNIAPTQVTFPELRSLMAKFGVNQTEMGQVTGDTYATFGRKLRMQGEFTFSEMMRIRDYFIAKGETVTMQRLFFDWIIHNSESVQGV